MEDLVVDRIVSLVLKNKYEPTHAGQKKLFNDLKKYKDLNEYSILLKDLTGANAGTLGGIIMYSCYVCNLYKEGRNIFAKYPRPYNLISSSKSELKKAIIKNIKKETKIHGFINVPVKKSQKKDIEKTSKKLQDIAYKEYLNSSDSFDLSVNQVLFAIFGIPILIFLLLLPIEFSWTGQECGNTMAIIDYTDATFMEKASQYKCREAIKTFEYPILFKAILAFVSFLHIVLTGRAETDRVVDEDKPLSRAMIFIFLTMPFVAVIGGLPLYWIASAILDTIL